MTVNLKGLGKQDPDTVLLHEELQARLGRLQEAGAIDLKAMCSSDRNSSTVDKLWTLNNVLRRSEEGKTVVTVLEA